MELGEEIYDELMADKIYPGSRELAQRHLDAGQRVWLVTATPVELAQIIGRRLGLTGALGTVAENVDGVYTGRLFGEMLHGQAKAAAVRSLAAREGLDLRRCTAYSDSVNDVPMLSVVGTAVAINPDSALQRRRPRARLADQGLPHRTQGRQDLGADGGRRRCRRRRGAGRPVGLAQALTGIRPVVGISPGTGARGGAATGTGSAGWSPAPGR